MVKWCCSCTRHSTCSTTGPSAPACEFCNTERQCTGCYCWGKCKNKGRLMPSPTTTRGLLVLFPRGVDPPANNPRATTPPVRSPTSLSLWEILAAGAGGRSARGGGERPQGPAGEEEERNRGGGGSEGWSGRSDDESDAETAEEGWGHDMLTALPWGTKEKGARGLRVDARAGGSDGQKSPSATTDEAGTRGRHGLWQGQREKNGGRREL